MIDKVIPILLVAFAIITVSSYFALRHNKRALMSRAMLYIGIALGIVCVMALCTRREMAKEEEKIPQASIEITIRDNNGNIIESYVGQYTVTINPRPGLIY